jgi:serine/threonine-protein kinase
VTVGNAVGPDDTLAAARAAVGAGDREGALAALIRGSSRAADYGERCTLAVALADELDRLTLGLDNLVAGFVRRGPENAGEADAFECLAGLYERHGFAENARETAAKLLAYAPEHSGARRLLARLPQPVAPAPLLDLPEVDQLGPAAAPPTVAPGLSGPQLRPFDEQPPLREGVLVGGRYRLEARIGSGGSSVVFRAQDQELGDHVAVKVFTTLHYDPESDARLQRELLLARQLVHPNVVRVLELGRSSGFRYLTMEWLDGATLAERLRQGPVPLDEALRYLLEICAGLQAAHDLSIVHRDVKPANCFVQRGGGLKVLDFGIAKVRDAPGLTQTGALTGSPAYMAPEQALDPRAVTPASDIYSIGVVAYELLTSTPPFQAEHPLLLLERHRHELPRPLREVNPDLPPGLEQVVLRCLEKSPAVRFGSCRQLAAALGALRHG